MSFVKCMSFSLYAALEKNLLSTKSAKKYQLGLYRYAQTPDYNGRGGWWSRRQKGNEAVDYTEI